jgi:tetratricopeptide (TPR) repeat protein
MIVLDMKVLDTHLTFFSPFLPLQFENAIKVYNGGLRFANSLPYSSWTRETAAYIVEVNNTLAELYLRLNRHPEARQAAEAAFSLEPRHFRARYSLALANSLCGRHAEAVAGFRGLLWEVGNAEGETRWEREDDQELEDWEDRGGVGEKDLEVLLFHALKKAERRAKDARGGFFLFLSLYSYFPVGGMGGENDGASTAAAAALGAAREFLRRLLKEEVAPYVGPVEIRRAGRGWNGKGLFVTENVKADTIVLVEKAVAVMALSTEGDDEGDDGKGGGEEETPMTLYSKGMETLARVLRERAGKDRLANARLLSLSAAEIPPLDLFRTDCPETDETLEGIRPDEGVEAWLGKVLIKPSDVQQIVGCNVIATGSGARGAAAEITALTTVGTGAVAAALARVRLLTEEEKTATAGKKAKRIHMTVGLWPLAAFTVKLDPTHPPTVGRMRVGKYMIVRASRDLKKGEALFCKPGAGQAAREGRSGEEVREARGKGKVKGN